MPLRVLAAGGSKEEKDRVEALVRSALAARASESWFVSLVKLGNKWSVTLDGPGLRAVTLMSTEARLTVEMGAALGGLAPAAAPEPAPPPPAPPPAAPAPPVSARTPPPAPSPAPSAGTAPARPPTVLRRPTGASPSPAPGPAASPAPAARPSPPAVSPAPAASAKAAAARPPSAAPATTPAERPSSVRPPASPAPAPPPASVRGAPAASNGERRDRLSCTRCGEAFAVVYVEEDPDEAQETVAVACPHCWHINQAMLPASVAYNNEYRAEKP